MHTFCSRYLTPGIPLSDGYHLRPPTTHVAVLPHTADLPCYSAWLFSSLLRCLPATTHYHTRRCVTPHALLPRLLPHVYVVTHSLNRWNVPHDASTRIYVATTWHSWWMPARVTYAPPTGAACLDRTNVGDVDYTRLPLPARCYLTRHRRYLPVDGAAPLLRWTLPSYLPSLIFTRWFGFTTTIRYARYPHHARLI